MRNPTPSPLRTFLRAVDEKAASGGKVIWYSGLP